MQQLHEEGAFAGLEALIVKGDSVLVHDSWGYADRELQSPMPLGGIFNIRSMTKPIAASVLLSMEQDGLISLDDPVSLHLTEFEHNGLSDLTIRQFLLHRAGYQQGQAGKSWRLHDSLATMAGYWAETGNRPGLVGTWSYADAHADILGHLAQRVSGLSISELINQRVFKPLGMASSYVAEAENPDLEKRTLPLHVQSDADWEVFWRPEEGPFYPFGMFAQSVFSSASDLVLFMRFWGECVQEIIAPYEGVPCERVPEALANRMPLNLPAGVDLPFPNLEPSYGYFWGLMWDPQSSDGSPPEAFFHQGSDGTAMWAIPEADIYAVFLTQSRGTAALSQIESAFARHIVDQFANH